MSGLVVLVVTGGPGSGKTTALRRMARDARFKGRVTFVREAAAALITKLGLA